MDPARWVFPRRSGPVGGRGAPCGHDTAIADGESIPELAELSARRDALGERVLSALAERELTAERIEALKEQVVEESARLSERAVEIAFEIASELTPAQRAELLEHRGRR